MAKTKTEYLATIVCGGSTTSHAMRPTIDAAIDALRPTPGSTLQVYRVNFESRRIAGMNSWTEVSRELINEMTALPGKAQRKPTMTKQTTAAFDRAHAIVEQIDVIAQAALRTAIDAAWDGDREATVTEAATILQQHGDRTALDERLRLVWSIDLDDVRREGRIADGGRYEIHVVRDAEVFDLPLPEAFDAFDSTTLVSWTDSPEDARRIAASEGTGLPHGCVVIDVVEGAIDFGDRVVRQPYTYADAVARLAALGLPEDLASFDGTDDQEHWEWLHETSDDEVRGWAQDYVSEIGGEA